MQRTRGNEIMWKRSFESHRQRQARRCIRIITRGEGAGVQAWSRAGDCRECGWELNDAGECENHQCPLSARYSTYA